MSSNTFATATGSDAPLLQADGIAKAFNGVPAIIDGRITVRPGTVNALCGGNGAGKSTFLNVLMGLLHRDSGMLHRDGRAVDYASAAEALADGIGIITQELSPIPDMSVAENLLLGREPRRGGWFVDRSLMHRDAQALIDRLGFGIDVRLRMGDLSVARIQLVEIAKAIGRNSRVIIMDEPTSAIGEREAGILFDAIRSLKEHGVGIIYVSHRLDDIFAIADDYTVFRDARFIEEGRIADLDRDRLISLIVGRDLGQTEQRPPRAQAPVRLELRGLSDGRHYDDISLTVQAGEIVGLYGLMGAGRSEVAAAVFGMEKFHRGEVLLDGKPLHLNSPRDALAAGIAMITEDRKGSGLVLPASVAHNMTMSALDHVSKGGFIRAGHEAEVVDGHIDRFGVRTASRDLPVQFLSGGNQQKVVIAKCVETRPEVLICDEPTRGVDEGAKRDSRLSLRIRCARRRGASDLVRDPGGAGQFRPHHRVPPWPHLGRDRHPRSESGTARPTGKLSEARMSNNADISSTPRGSHASRAMDFLAKWGIVLSLVILILAMSFLHPNFLSTANITNILRQVSINGILAVGMTFVILTAGIDLSIGSVLAFCGIVAGMLVTGADPVNPLIAVLAAMGAGALFGATNGLLVARFSVTPFVVTLGMLSMARGLTLLLSNGRPVPGLSEGFRWIGQGFILGVPVPVWIFLVVFLIAWITLRFTVFGRWIYAVGGNPKAARTSGIPTRTVIFSAYLIMGLLAGLAGAVLTARTTAGLPQAGIGYELDAIAAVVIGGTSLMGGVGSIAFTLVGVLIIGVIANGLDLLGVSSYYQEFVKGAIIVIAVLIDRSRNKAS